VDQGHEIDGSSQVRDFPEHFVALPATVEPPSWVASRHSVSTMRKSRGINAFRG
jgi:hypothetical protein